MRKAIKQKGVGKLGEKEEHPVATQAEKDESETRETLENPTEEDKGITSKPKERVE